jgi:hypothetical protein
MLEWGDVFGPWTAGPDGCALYGFIAGNGAPFFDKVGWQKHLDDAGATELGVPMPSMPIWVGNPDVLPKTE